MVDRQDGASSFHYLSSKYKHSCWTRNHCVTLNILISKHYLNIYCAKLTDYHSILIVIKLTPVNIFVWCFAQLTGERTYTLSLGQCRICMCRFRLLYMGVFARFFRPEFCCASFCRFCNCWVIVWQPPEQKSIFFWLKVVIEQCPGKMKLTAIAQLVWSRLVRAIALLLRNLVST